MALIPCWECHREISSEAPACPHCGAPKIAATPTSPTVTCQHCESQIPAGLPRCPKCNARQEDWAADFATTDLTRGMSDRQVAIFQLEMAANRKNPTAALFLTLLLGGLGGHQFYLGHVGLGLVYVLFCWTFIPLIISFFELFLITGRVERYNAEKAQEIATRVRGLG